MLVLGGFLRKLKLLIPFAAIFLLIVSGSMGIAETNRVLGVQENLIKNGNFNTRTFDGWNVSGCFSLVLPPKESAAKAGPEQYDGECVPGESGTISQSLVVSGTQYISFRYREILRGDNRITVVFSDDNGWNWVARDTTAQNATFAYTPLVTNSVPIPIGTERITITITSQYCPSLTGCRIGTKITAIEVHK